MNFSSIYTGPDAHSYDLLFRIDNGTTCISQQDTVAAIGRVAVPGNILSAPIQNGALNMVYGGGIPVGHVEKFSEASTGTYVNYTMQDHLLYSGFAALTVSDQGQYTYLSVHGGGQNYNSTLALLNKLAAGPFAFNSVATNLQNLVNPLGHMKILSPNSGAH